MEVTQRLIPPPQDDDDEDVHWALSTASALWGRGEREEALRWLRRAAEQASDVNADLRALELFKAAAEVATRMSNPPPAQTPAPPPPAPVQSAPPRAPAPVAVELAAPERTRPPPAAATPPPGRPAPPGRSVPPPPVRVGGSSWPVAVEPAPPARVPSGAPPARAASVAPAGPAAQGAATAMTRSATGRSEHPRAILPAQAAPAQPPARAPAQQAPAQHPVPQQPAARQRPSAQTPGAAQPPAPQHAAGARVAHGYGEERPAASPQRAAQAPDERSARAHPAAAPHRDGAGGQGGGGQAAHGRGAGQGAPRERPAGEEQVRRAKLAARVATKIGFAPVEPPVGQPAPGAARPADAVASSRRRVDRAAGQPRQPDAPEERRIAWADDEVTMQRDLNEIRREARELAGLRVDDLDEDTRVIDGSPASEHAGGAAGEGPTTGETMVETGLVGRAARATAPADGPEGATANELDDTSGQGGVPGGAAPEDGRSWTGTGDPTRWRAPPAPRLPAPALEPLAAVRVAVLGTSAPGEVRLVPLGAGIEPPTGAAAAILVPLTAGDAEAIARLFSGSA